MTDKELVDELLRSYEMIYRRVAECETGWEACQFLRINAAGSGICEHSFIIFGEHITDRWWVKKYIVPGKKWWIEPTQGGTKMVILSRIQKRIEILRLVKDDLHLKEDGSL